MRTIIPAGVLALAMLWTPPVLADESATVKLGGGWIALGLGTNWGDGMLTFAGCDYPFSLQGLSMGEFGAAGFTASGTVRGLDRAEDFNGRYTNVGAGLAVLGDGSAVTLENDKGVTIDLVLATPGFKVSLGRGGIEMAIPPSSIAAAHTPEAAERSAGKTEDIVCRRTPGRS